MRDGKANGNPLDHMANQPCDRTSSTPPELPGLMAASVCSTLRMGMPRGPGVCSSRPTPEMMPCVSVWSSPKGLPMAYTLRAEHMQHWGHTDGGVGGSTAGVQLQGSMSVEPCRCSVTPVHSRAHGCRGTLH